MYFIIRSSACPPGGAASLPPVQVQTSLDVPVPVHRLTSKEGWCDQPLAAQTVDKDSNNNNATAQLTLMFTFPVPKVGAATDHWIIPYLISIVCHLLTDHREVAH
jgi:hypothetical protein